MNKTSKVIAVQSSGSWEGNYGVMYKFEVSFENGDTGEYSSKAKDQTKFVIGKEAEYTFTGGQHPKVKPVYNAPASGGGFTPNSERDLKIVKQSSLKVATDICIANNKTDLNTIFKTANTIISWVNDTGAAAPKKETDNLPF